MEAATSQLTLQWGVLVTVSKTSKTEQYIRRWFQYPENTWLEYTKGTLTSPRSSEPNGTEPNWTEEAF